MGIVKLDQHSPEWLQWRKEGIGASDSGIIMGVNPWRSIDQLLDEKTADDIFQMKPNKAMQRGIDLEPVARMLHTKRTMIEMPPVVMEDEENPFLKASLDGYSQQHNVSLEIKVPRKEDHMCAYQGRVPDKYIYQCQHILMVSKAKILHYVSYNGKSIHNVYVLPDKTIQAQLLDKEKEFWGEVLKRREDKKNGLIPEPKPSSVRRVRMTR